MQGSQIVARIKYLAAVRGVPMETLYADCKISSSAVSQWKSGTTKPSFNSVQKIATYLGTTSEYLLFGDGDISEKAQTDFPKSGLRLPDPPQPRVRQSGLVIGGAKKTASPQADGVIDKLISLNPELRDLFVRILAAAKEDPERVKRYLAFLVQELESQR